MLLTLPWTSRSQGDKLLSPYEKKGGYVAFFAQYTVFPPEVADQAALKILRILIIGNFSGWQEMREAILKLSPLRDGRRLEVIQVPSIDTERDVEGYHVVFISKGVPKRLIPAVMAKLPGTGVLTIGELEGFTRQGGMVSLVLVEEKEDVFLEIDEEKARKAKLTFNNDFLNTIRPLRLK